MELTILGSGSAIPVADRNPAAYLLDVEGETILIDSGTGACRQIAKAGRELKEINKVFYSHFHIDHIGELPSLLFAIKNSDFEATNTSLKIYAHKNFKKFIDNYSELYGDWIKNPDYPYEFHPLVKPKIEFNSFTLFTFPANHNPESLIFRFETKDGKSLVYTGDTDFCQELINAAQDTDLLLTECSFPDSYEVKGHMSPKKVKQVIELAQPKQTLLTHLYPQNDNSSLIERVGCADEHKLSVAKDLDIIKI
ncbi:MAG: ribonuclease Z [Candidatus Marinimicrobia bacterium]|nr:ribonuclease Z [Candidatus Neomarinimicrobiota bacterium]